MGRPIFVDKDEYERTLKLPPWHSSVPVQRSTTPASTPWQMALARVAAMRQQWAPESEPEPEPVEAHINPAWQAALGMVGNAGRMIEQGGEWLRENAGPWVRSGFDRRSGMPGVDLSQMGENYQAARENVPGLAAVEDAAGDVAGVLGDVGTAMAPLGQYAGGLEAVQGPRGSYPRLSGPGVGLAQLREDLEDAGGNPLEALRSGIRRNEQTTEEAVQGQPEPMQAAGRLILPQVNPATFTMPIEAPRVLKGAADTVAAAREAAELAAREAGPIARSTAETVAPDVWRGMQRLGAVRTFAEEGMPGNAGGKTLGSVTRATGADPTKAYEFRYRVVPLDELVTSHTDALALNPDFPQELQPRLRDRAASKVQISKIASELVPDALLSDVQQLDRGPMIVGADSIVESGNGRVLALRRAREAHPENFAAYGRELRQRLPEYGIDPAAAQGIKDPVLVRERITSVDRPAFAAEANQATTLTMSAYEQALQDAGRISDNTLAGLQVGENQSLDSALQAAGNRDILRQFVANIPENERAAVIGPRGELSQPGLQRLKAALFARTYPGEAGQRLTQTFFESLDPTVKNIENGMLSSLPAMGKAEGLIRAGLRDAELSLADDLSKAVNVLARLREQGMSVDQFLAQSSMFERELTPFQETLLKYLSDNGRSPKRVREFISGYANAVEQAPVKGQGAFFDMGAPTKGDILDAIARRQAKAAEHYPLFAQAQEATAPVQEGPQLAGAGEGQGVAPQRTPEPPVAAEVLTETSALQADELPAVALIQRRYGVGYARASRVRDRMGNGETLEDALRAEGVTTPPPASVETAGTAPSGTPSAPTGTVPEAATTSPEMPPASTPTPTVPPEVQAARDGDSLPLRTTYRLTQDQADQLLQRLDRGEPFDGALAAVGGRRQSSPSAQPSRPFTVPERPRTENQPLELVADPSTGQLRFVPEGTATLPPRPTPPQTTKATKAKRVQVGIKQPEDVTALAHESLGRAIGTPEQAAELRRPQSGYAGNVRLERFDPEVRPLIQQALDESNQFAGQRRGVVGDAEVRQRAAELALHTPIAAWLKTKPGRAFNAEEATALGLTLDRVGMEFNNLSSEVHTAQLAGKATAEMERTLAEKALQFAALEATLSGGTSEAGRTLRAFRQTLEGGAKYKVPQAEAIKRAFKAIGTDEGAFKEWVTRWNALAPDDYIGRYRLLQALHKPTRMQQLVAWTTSNMLSGLRTLETNLAGNLLNSVNRPLVTALGGDLRAATDDVVAMGRAIGRAWADSGTAFWTGVRPSLAEEAAQLGKYDARPDAFPGRKGVAITPALRVMVWGDEFARTINAAGALANIARRESRRTGKTVRELLADPSDSMLKYAQDAADNSVYEGKPSAIAQMLLSGRNKIYKEGAGNRATGMAFYVLTPFVRVPDAIIVKGAKMTAKPATALYQIPRALLKGDTAEAQRHLGETILATGALTAFYAEAAAGNITGDGPQNPSQRKVLQEARDENGNPIWQAHSIRIGDRWFDYTNLGHYAIPMAAMANAVEAFRYEGKKPDPEYVAAVVNRTVKVMADASYVRALGSIFRAVFENRVSDLGTSIPTDVGSRLIPYGGAVSQIARTADTDVKAPSSIAEGLAARIPGANQLVEDRLSAFGTPVEQPVDVWSSISPFKTSAPGTPNAAAVELARLGLGLTPASDEIQLSGEANPRKLTEDQQRAYQRTLGQGWQTALTSLFNQEYYRAASDEDKKRIIGAVENKIRDMVQDSLRAELRGKTPIPSERLARDAAEFPTALGFYREWQAIPSKRGMTAEAANEAARILSYYNQVRRLSNGNTATARQLTVQQFGSDAFRKMQEYNARPDNPERARYWQQHRQMLEKYFKGAAGADLAARQAG